jgi:glycoprotein endo-alpha-1,2-mannosidase
MLGLVAAVLAVAALLSGGANSRTVTPAEPDALGAGEVAIFYYPWYGTEKRDGNWQHWHQNGNRPPAQIASGWFPARGLYSSSDLSVVRAQMREIAAMGIQTVIVSWWGGQSPEAARLPMVSRSAQDAGLRVALHVEPFAGRTPAALEAEINSFRAAGITDFYLYDSTLTPDADWAALNERVSGVRLFANTSFPGKARAGGFDGLYTYDVYIHNGGSFPRICASARKLGLVCAPSVGPGYDAVRATGDARVRGRADGAAYDRMWRCAVRAGADVVTITSYNEWHEGTQIEAAKNVGVPYASYDGAYGLAGPAAQRAYLDRTSMWVGRYREQVGRARGNETSR